MRKRALNNLASRRRTQLKARHQQTMSRQKKFFALFSHSVATNEQEL